MSAIYGTNLATDGLEILFDPNNPGSYPGSGDSIFDLSGNSRTGTLYGSPSFSANYMNFDGSNDYIQFPTLTLDAKSVYISIVVDEVLVAAMAT